MNFLTIFITIILFTTVYARFLGCLPERRNYKLYYPCQEGYSEEEDRTESLLRGEPTRFARTGFYDRLFRNANTIQWMGQYAYYPTYGFNANLPEGVYRYSNFFTKPVET